MCIFFVPEQLIKFGRSSQYRRQFSSPCTARRMYRKYPRFPRHKSYRFDKFVPGRSDMSGPDKSGKFDESPTVSQGK
jgi:hypothetical protein